MIRYASPTFNSDSVALATGGFDGTVRLYDAATDALKKAFAPGGPR
jgi:WD40 repeat protein